MGNHTSIEWTDSTWNPVTGCTKVSEGCDHCYAHTLAHGRLADVYSRQLPVVDTEGNRADPFAVRLWADRLQDPKRGPDRMVFVNSMSDLFHVDVPDAFIRRVFEVMLRERRHIYQVLTKRVGRAIRWLRANADLFAEWGGRVPWWIWLGASVEHQPMAYRAVQLASIAAEVRFISYEPALGPLWLRDITRSSEPEPGRPQPVGGPVIVDVLEGTAVNRLGLEYATGRIHQVIAGGESGDGFRRPVPDWFRMVRTDCEMTGTPFLFKQWGGRTPKAGGRLLDGRTHDGYPMHPAVQDWLARNRREVAA